MGYAAVRSVEIGGPYLVADTVTETPSRRAIFTCEPSGVDEERGCATEILSSIARRAFRRPVTGGEVDSLLGFFDEGRAAGSFEAGIQFALERILVDPDFLLRVYRDPIDLDRTTYALSDLELASRLSFFLWSSIPDEPLLQLARGQGRLSDPAVLEQQVRRMLLDPRATAAIVEDFAAQWLNLRRVGEVVVDPVQYPALRREPARCLRGGGHPVRGQHADRGSQRARSARRGLHVRQRAARAPLRVAGNLRQPVPAGDVPEHRTARGPVGRRRAAGHDVVPRPDLSRAAREVAGRQHLRFARAGAAGRRQHRPGGDARRGPGDDTRASRAPSAEPDLRELSRGDRPARLRAGELRRDRRLARRRRTGPADRQRGHDNRAGSSSTGWRACARCSSTTRSSSRGL